MKYCYECGEKLHMKELEHEGMVPFVNHAVHIAFLFSVQRFPW